MSSRTKKRFDPARHSAEALIRRRQRLDRALMLLDEKIKAAERPFAVWDQLGGVEIYGTARPSTVLPRIAVLLGLVCGYSSPLARRRA